MRQKGSSIVEVVVMMVIMSVAIVGVYSMVNNGQKLAKSTDDRLIAINLAKEWLESIGALRDTFTLRAFTGNAVCFFTIDGSNPDDTNCYETNKKYLLKDDRTILSSDAATPVCITDNWWYSQTCPAGIPTCGGLTQKGCRTQFSRSIGFQNCWGGLALSKCVVADVEITWWRNQEDSLSLDQIFTRQ